MTNYQQAILDLLAGYQRPSTSVETMIVTDSERHHYQVSEAGWTNSDHYFYGVLFHLHIKPNGKIYILENNTEDDLADALAERGVSKSDIVLNFIPERLRQKTEFAVA